jgi:hypothetical protein
LYILSHHMFAMHTFERINVNFSRGPRLIVHANRPRFCWTVPQFGLFSCSLRKSGTSPGFWDWHHCDRGGAAGQAGQAIA